MAVIRDVMPAFELFQPVSIEDAQAVLGRYGSNAWVPRHWSIWQGSRS
jgi:hypothetical protein